MLVDDQQRTSVEGIFALGDVELPFQLKHVANHEAKVVQHNLLHPRTTAAQPTTGSCRPRCSPIRRSPPSGAPRPSAGRSASTTS